MSRAFVKEEDMGAAEVRRPVVQGAVHLTPQGVEALRLELRELQQRRASTPERDRVELDMRLREIEAKLASAVIVETGGESDVVRFGSTVSVRSVVDGEEEQYRIVGPAEIDLSRNWISSASPLAKALLNHRAGERVQFRSPLGEETLDILSVSS